MYLLRRGFCDHDTRSFLLFSSVIYQNQSSRFQKFGQFFMSCHLLCKSIVSQTTSSWHSLSRIRCSLTANGIYQQYLYALSSCNRNLGRLNVLELNNISKTAMINFKTSTTPALSPMADNSQTRTGADDKAPRKLRASTIERRFKKILTKAGAARLGSGEHKAGPVQRKGPEAAKEQRE